MPDAYVAANFFVLTDKRLDKNIENSIQMFSTCPSDKKIEASFCSNTKQNKQLFCNCDND